MRDIAGPGGWACILRCAEGERQFTGQAQQTTRHRMELTATITGLSALRRRCDVELINSPPHIQRGVLEDLTAWKANGWRHVNNKPVYDRDLWERLDELIHKHQITWRWASVDQNRCRALARSAALIAEELVRLRANEFR